MVCSNPNLEEAIPCITTPPLPPPHSAGVGRSGTVMAIDYCLKQLKNDQYMDPCGFIQKMRNQRNYMVQTEQQYTFLHFALLEAITYGDTSFDLSTFSDSYQSLQEINPVSGLTLLEEEFRRIGCVKTMTKRSSFQQKIKNKGAPQRHFNSSCECVCVCVVCGCGCECVRVCGWVDKCAVFTV